MSMPNSNVHLEAALSDTEIGVPTNCIQATKVETPGQRVRFGSNTQYYLVHEGVVYEYNHKPNATNVNFIKKPQIAYSFQFPFHKGPNDIGEMCLYSSREHLILDGHVSVFEYGASISEMQKIVLTEYAKIFDNRNL